MEYMFLEDLFFINVFGVGGDYILFVDFVEEVVFGQYSQCSKVVNYCCQYWQGDVLQVVEDFLISGEGVEIW